MIGWQNKTDGEEKSTREWLMTGAITSKGPVHGCHGNLSFLCTDWEAQYGGRETIYQDFPQYCAVQETDKETELKCVLFFALMETLLMTSVHVLIFDLHPHKSWVYFNCFLSDQRIYIHPQVK